MSTDGDDRVAVVSQEGGREGITIREHFACQLLAALVQHYGATEPVICIGQILIDLPVIAVRLADALISSLNAKSPKSDDWRAKEGIPD